MSGKLNRITIAKDAAQNSQAHIVASAKSVCVMIATARFIQWGHTLAIQSKRFK